MIGRLLALRIFDFIFSPEKTKKIGDGFATIQAH